MKNNPTSAITAFGTLFLSIVTTIYAVLAYMKQRKMISTEDVLRDEYDMMTSEYAQKLLMLADPHVDFFHKFLIKLRVEWTLGACFIAYSGDPNLRSHRLLIVWATFLMAMVFTVIFLVKPDPDCYEDCPDETFSGGDPACKENCNELCKGNGKLAGWFTSLCLMPTMWALNKGFAWLRLPAESHLNVLHGLAGQAHRDAAAAAAAAAENPDAADDKSKDGSVAKLKAKLKADKLKSELKANSCSFWLNIQHCLHSTFPCCKRAGHSEVTRLSARLQQVPDECSKCQDQCSKRRDLAMYRENLANALRLACRGVAGSTISGDTISGGKLLEWTTAAVSHLEPGKNGKKGALSLPADLLANVIDACKADSGDEIIIEMDLADRVQGGMAEPAPEAEPEAEPESEVEPEAEAAAAALSAAAGEADEDFVLNKSSAIVWVSIFMTLEHVRADFDAAMEALKKDDAVADGATSKQFVEENLSQTLIDLNNRKAISEYEETWIMNNADYNDDARIQHKQLYRTVANWFSMTFNAALPDKPEDLAPCPISTTHAGRRLATRKKIDALTERLRVIFQRADDTADGIITEGALAKMIAAVKTDKKVVEILGHDLEGSRGEVFKGVDDKLQRQGAVVLTMAAAAAFADERQTITSKLQEHNLQTDGSTCSEELLKKLMEDLDDGVSPSKEQVAWVHERGTDAGVIKEKKKFQEALETWYSQIHTRHLVGEDKPPRSTVEHASHLRVIEVAQAKVHGLAVESALKRVKLQSDGSMSRDQLAALLEYLNPDGGAMPSSQVAFVLNLADVKDQERIKKEDIQAVLGLWRTTYKEMARFRQAIDKLETKPDGKLSTEQVESILKTANGDKDCQSTDLEFVLGTVPHGKTLGLSPDELMLAIPNWYCHVENYYIKTRSGWKLAIPFLCELKARQNLRAHSADCSNTLNTMVQT